MYGGNTKYHSNPYIQGTTVPCDIVLAGLGGQDMANFINEACTTDGVKPTDSLLFTCEIYGVILLRVLLPTGVQEIISVGDTAADVALPAGFTAVSLDVTEIVEDTRNFILTLSIDSALHLNGGNITCDDTTPGKAVEAGCPIGKLTS